MDEHEHKQHFHIAGMSCTNCARRVEQSLSKLDGVKLASVNLATQTGFVVSTRPISFEEIAEHVKNTGYRAHRELDEDLEARRYRKVRRSSILAWAATLPLALLMILHMLAMGGGHAGPGAAGFAGITGWFPWLELVAGGFVVFWAGRDTIRGAWIALAHGHTNMDTLIMAGAVASLLTTVLHLAGVPVASFGTIGAMIVALHLAGRYIESRLRDRAAKEVRALLRLQAREARVLVDGAEVSMPIAAVKAGAQVLVRPGERVPVDGRVDEGVSAVDESMITGEAIPVHKAAGSELTGGSLNLTGVLRLTATRVGQDSFLSKMVGLIQEVQGGKVPIQALADRITFYFVPAVVLLAALSGLAWYLLFPYLQPLLGFGRAYLPWVVAPEGALSFAVFVFIATILIACPCALGLATPMALVRGTGLAARRGLIIRNAEAIQTSRDTAVVVLDKTGTLTRGEPQVTEHTLPTSDLATVAAIEASSNHPLARAIASLATPTQRAAITVEDLEEVAGEGVRARAGGRSWFIGRPRDAGMYASLLAEGKTVVEVRRDGEPLGMLAIEDPLRDDAAAAVAALQRLGLEPVMATGDQEQTARAVARRVGITTVLAGVRPAEKLDIVRRYQGQGRRTMMVGDGINDAAALKGADIGVALGSGMDLAIDTADVVVVRGGLTQVVDLLEVSRSTFRIIRQNLFWAFIYNLVAIPLAMLGMLHPAIAELAMLLSSITVVLNALRIRLPDTGRVRPVGELAAAQGG